MGIKGWARHDEKLYEYYTNAEERLLHGTGYERSFSSEDFYIYFLAHEYKHYAEGIQSLFAKFFPHDKMIFNILEPWMFTHAENGFEMGNVRFTECVMIQYNCMKEIMGNENGV